MLVQQHQILPHCPHRINYHLLFRLPLYLLSVPSWDEYLLRLVDLSFAFAFRDGLLGHPPVTILSRVFVGAKVVGTFGGWVTGGSCTLVELLFRVHYY